MQFTLAFQFKIALRVKKLLYSILPAFYLPSPCCSQFIIGFHVLGWGVERDGSFSRITQRTIVLQLFSDRTRWPFGESWNVLWNMQQSLDHVQSTQQVSMWVLLFHSSRLKGCSYCTPVYLPIFRRINYFSRALFKQISLEKSFLFVSADDCHLNGMGLRQIF